MTKQSEETGTGAGSGEGVNEEAGFTLTDLREAAGLSQKQVAERMGVSRGRIPQIEADYPNVHHLVAMRYLDAVGASVRIVVGGLRMDAGELVEDVNRVLTKNRRRRRPGEPVRTG